MTPGGLSQRRGLIKVIGPSSLSSDPRSKSLLLTGIGVVGEDGRKPVGEDGRGDRKPRLNVP